MKPAFGYIRVSGRGQLDGDGESRQRASIERFAAARGYTVLRWFFDGGVSGETEADNREQYAEMLSLVGDATTRTILVESSDRLGRTLVVCEMACEAARKAGLTIISADSGLDLTNSDDPSRVAIRQMMGVMAEMNKNVLVKRMRHARNRIRSESGHCEGVRPFGERENPDDEFTLSLLATMKLSDYSIRDMASELNRRHRPSPTGRQWAPSTVHRVLARGLQSPLIELRSDSKLLEGLAV